MTDAADELPLPLPWHASILDELQRGFAMHRLPHAILLTCNPGWGHRELLASAAAQLMGFDITEQPIESLAHPDFRWIEPDGAVIKIDQIRQLNEFAAQTVQAGGCKVAAVASAHSMNNNAANALLKTLEEPPPNTHIVLATDTWSRVLPTIRSRAQRFDVNEDIHLAKRWLQQQGVDVDDAQLLELGRAPLSVLLAAQQPDFLIWLNQLNGANVSAAAQQVAELDLGVWLARWYRRISLHLQGESIARLHAPAREVLAFSDGLLSVRRQVLESNAANQRLLLEGLISSWLRLLS